MKPKIPDDVKKVIDSFPTDARARLMEIRSLILECAAKDEIVGPLTETLKWNEPAYLTEKSKSGSTIRIGYKEARTDVVAMYFNCQTTIINDIQQRYPNRFQCDSNRALLIPLDKSLPEEELSGCIDIALKYHVNKKHDLPG